MPQTIEEVINQAQSDIDRMRDELAPAMAERAISILDDDHLPSVNEQIEKGKGFNDRFAEKITNVVGNIWFAYILLIWMCLWIASNIVLMKYGYNAFDEPWEFSTLLFCNNVIQLLSPIFIMVNQKQQEKRDRLNAERDRLALLKAKRDSLAMFIVMQEFAENMEAIAIKLDMNQRKLVAFGEDQDRFLNEISASVLLISADEESRMEGIERLSAVKPERTGENESEG